jgi:hypothetical protein
MSAPSGKVNSFLLRSVCNWKGNERFTYGSDTPPDRLISSRRRVITRVDCLFSSRIRVSLTCLYSTFTRAPGRVVVNPLQSIGNGSWTRESLVRIQMGVAYPMPVDTHVKVVDIHTTLLFLGDIKLVGRCQVRRYPLPHS